MLSKEFKEALFTEANRLLNFVDKLLDNASEQHIKDLEIEQGLKPGSLSHMKFNLERDSVLT